MWFHSLNFHNNNIKKCIKKQRFIKIESIIDHNFVEYHYLCYQNFCKMINVTLPDGSIKQYEKGTSALDVAKSISEGLARNVLAAKIDGKVVDAILPISTDCSLQLLTWNDQEGKSTMWHSSAHIMAEALEFYFPGIKLAIGPPVANGFYYDVDFMEQSISEKDLEKIEQKMKELAKEKNAFVRKDVSKADAIAYFTEKEDPYKLELIEGRNNYILYARKLHGFMSWTAYSRHRICESR